MASPWNNPDMLRQQALLYEQMESRCRHYSGATHPYFGVVWSEFANDMGKTALDLRYRANRIEEPPRTPDDVPCGKCKEGCGRDSYYPSGWCGECIPIREKSTGRLLGWAGERTPLETSEGK